MALSAFSQHDLAGQQTDTLHARLLEINQRGFGTVLHLEKTAVAHRERFLAAVERSRNLHRPWVSPANTASEFNRYLEKYRSENNISLLAIDDAGQLVGCINLNEIVRGSFQSAYLGYFAFEPCAGKGLMQQALRLVIDYAFKEVGLHRLEANIQPSNSRSIKLVETLGFRHEGFSPNYLKIANEWKSHERFALTVEDIMGWPGSRA